MIDSSTDEAPRTRARKVKLGRAVKIDGITVTLLEIQRNAVKLEISGAVHVEDVKILDTTPKAGVS